MFDDFELIHSYTRAEALEDGFLIDVTETAKEAGIKFPVAVTAELFHSFIKPTQAEEEHGQDLEGRLWDVLFMFTYSARTTDGPMLLYKVVFVKEQPDRTLEQETQELKAVIGPGDTPEPVITIMLPWED